MALFLIVYAFITVCIIRRVIVKAKDSQQNSNTSNNYGTQTVYMPPKTDIIGAAQAEIDRSCRMATQPISASIHESRQVLQQSKQQSMQQSKQQNMQQSKQQLQQSKQQTTQKTAEKKISTTDYLERKAKIDQMEHAKEKQEELRRVNQRYGGQGVGGRYLIGDPVPRGMKLFYCPYCGAENIVPYDYRSGKDCYFCRSELK